MPKQIRSYWGADCVELQYLDEDLHISLVPPNAIIIDTRGNKNPNGKFVAIPLQDLQYDVYTINTGKKSRGPKYFPLEEASIEITPNKQRKYEKILQNLLKELGIGYMDSVGLFKLSTEIPIVAWAQNKDREDEILINPKVLEYGTKHVINLVRLMVLGRLLSRRQRSKDRASKPAVLMASLAMAARLITGDRSIQDANFVKTLNWLLGHESLKNDLFQCTNAEATIEDPLVKATWNEIFGRDERYASYYFDKAAGDLSVDNLYWLFKEFFPKDQECGFLLGDAGEELSDGSILFGEQPNSDKKISNLEEKTLDYTHHKNWSSAVSKLSKQIKEEAKSSSLDENFKKFLAQIQTEKLLQDTKSQIISSLSDLSRLLPIPIDLTYKGLVMMSCGFEGKDYPFYYCKSPDGAKKKVAAFYDISPSMRDFVAEMCGIVDAVSQQSNIDFTGNYSFAGEVAKMSEKEFEEFKKGNHFDGYSTCFEEVIQYVNEQLKDDVDVILIFTDGLSDVSKETIDKFNTSNKKCYNIYFNHHQDMIKSPLDFLHGQSFTLKINHDQK